ncbi:hypothetical protein Goshw_001936, partial [Gossypium schwendimanii]|nr:hypothetical protein [Gossypium schwendimanii]
MESCVYSWDKVSDPTTTEAKACLQVAIFAEDLRFREVSVKSDALTVLSNISLEQQTEWHTDWQFGDNNLTRRDSGWKRSLQKWESEESQQLVRLGNTTKYRKIWVK